MQSLSRSRATLLALAGFFLIASIDCQMKLGEGTKSLVLNRILFGAAEGGETNPPNTELLLIFES